MTIGIPTVSVVSLWRNDTQRRLAERAQHLLGKTYPLTRFVWVVGDCEDDTEGELRRIAAQSTQDIEIVRCDTTTHRPTLDVRFRCMGLAANAGFDRVRDSDQYILMHESDLLSPVNVIEQFLWHAARKSKDELGKCPIAGWPMLTMNSCEVFYDTWGYRAEGSCFANQAPYHAVYRPDVPFEVESVGSVWLFPADELRAGVRCDQLATLDLCRQMRARGRRIWVDPRIKIVQPRDLWVCY